MDAGGVACDDLEQFFPSFLDEHVALPQSRQAKRLLLTLSRNRATLNASGVFFSPSRLAVDARGTRSTMACQACGHCLHGCPYDLIYSTNGTLNEMIAAGRIEHRPGVTVQRVEEVEEGVRIHGITTEGDICVLEGKRVFLGAGALNTTAILLRSLGWYGRTLQMKDFQFFQLPRLHFISHAARRGEHLHALCQVFIDIFDERLSPQTIHLQIYTYNYIFREELATRLGPLATLFPKTLVLGRILLVQGLLHSSQSGTIDVTLRREGDEEFIELAGTGNPVSNYCVQRNRSQVIHARQIDRTASDDAHAQLGAAWRGLSLRGYISDGACAQPRAIGPAWTAGGAQAGLENVVDFDRVPVYSCNDDYLHGHGERVPYWDERGGDDEEGSGRGGKRCQRLRWLDHRRGCQEQRKGYWPVRTPRKDDDIGWSFSAADLHALAATLRERGVTDLVHAAWDMKASSMREMEASCVAGSARLFDAARAAGAQRLIFISTISAFDQARAAYGRSKLLIEKITLEAGGW